MRRYRNGGMLETVICNCCGKKMVVENGILREGAISIDHMWDYFSEKDGERHSFDLCEECYDGLIASFKLPVDIEIKAE